MVNLGIYCPDWMLARHNTDHKVVKMFSRLEEFSAIKTEFVASKVYTITFNVNRVIHRIAANAPSILQHGLRKTEDEIHMVYHYGGLLRPNSFFKKIGQLPTVVTTGFMTDRYVKDLYGKITDRQKEADHIAKSLDKAMLIHFHTNGGLQRFLNYRPDFKERATAIPFFLPNLSLFDKNPPRNPIEKNQLNILFVGNEGKRKGLHELIAALDLLGPEYLKMFNVNVTIVSKDKPRPKSGYNLKWFPKLPHKQVIELMHEASIFVLVPKNESYGLVLVEAMTANCAIITDDDDTRKEILGDTGILMSTQSAGTIAKTLRLLIEDDLLREQLGEKARLRAQKMFLPNIVAKQYQDCFQTLV